MYKYQMVLISVFIFINGLLGLCQKDVIRENLFFGISIVSILFLIKKSHEKDV